MELTFHASCEGMKKQKLVNVYMFFYGKHVNIFSMFNVFGSL
jgi:hypothetical protein